MCALSLVILFIHVEVIHMNLYLIIHAKPVLHFYKYLYPLMRVWCVFSSPFYITPMARL